MIVSSIIPPFSFRITDSVEEYGDSEVRDEGVSHSKKAVAPGPRKLIRFSFTTQYGVRINAHFD